MLLDLYIVKLNTPDIGYNIMAIGSHLGFHPTARFVSCLPFMAYLPRKYLSRQCLS